MFPSTTGGVNSSRLQFRAPMDSSGIESDLQHPSHAVGGFRSLVHMWCTVIVTANLFRF